ncbi:small integral membrane protein 15 [Petromyzon marinus]|uniref:Small integral membrane protein 15 n=1 Tax=Petromyzon marinus TaxID=7757 RepID=A0AAJ7U1N4_PETMA|nr:small integral membrane protein 15 [Petromyzon marinus]XP_061419907.1 small integral membrane protein 15 [Lethenteron reissneri]
MWETLQGWLQYCVEWAAKDPYGFLSTVLLALSPFFLASAALSWKLAKAIEARDRDAKKKAKRQENVLRSRNKGRKAE